MGRAYWCEVTALVHGAGRRMVLATFEASSPRVAMLWIVTRLREMAEQFDPQDAHWARQVFSIAEEHEAAMAAMVFGEDFALTLLVDQVVYVFSAGASTGLEARLPGRSGRLVAAR
ncbi:hypothetical protein HUT16_27245 [Kitasatospora sp. NA04385]|uniref:hypothetical protein n=1 Tax=Kitasatospora sp. NA04385 TaxID=2742135 RepID=UPI0015922A02|nr:hypothetical protein [Kitasatospora sp. NA04385]QKW22276.1 hypothetical protein HUT16_27245 [Kitasatospora sp. NA04385]